jgi:hypothetical protein
MISIYIQVFFAQGFYKDIRDCAIDTAAKLWAGRPRGRVSIPGTNKILSLLCKFDICSAVHSASYEIELFIWGLIIRIVNLTTYLYLVLNAQECCSYTSAHMDVSLLYGLLIQQSDGFTVTGFIKGLRRRKFFFGFELQSVLIRPNSIQDMAIISESVETLFGFVKSRRTRRPDRSTEPAESRTHFHTLYL